MTMTNPTCPVAKIDVSNLMMAGKHISVTHVRGWVYKFIGNGAQHAIATAVAASIAIKHGATPRQCNEFTC